MKYFTEFPTILYTFDPGLQEFKTVTDIFSRVRMLDSIVNNISVYYTYQMKESDTIESIAHKYYGDSNRHWIIYFTNKILDPYYDVPLQQQVLNLKIENLYGSIPAAMSNVHHIEMRTTTVVDLGGVSNTTTQVSNLTNDVISINDHDALPNVSNPVVQMSGNVSTTFPDGSVVTTSSILVAVTNYDYEIAANEERRSIKLIKKDFVSQIENELQNLLKQ